MVTPKKDSPVARVLIVDDTLGDTVPVNNEQPNIKQPNRISIVDSKSNSFASRASRSDKKRCPFTRL